MIDFYIQILYAQWKFNILVLAENSLTKVSGSIQKEVSTFSLSGNVLSSANGSALGGYFGIVDLTPYSTLTYDVDFVHTYSNYIEVSIFQTAYTSGSGFSTVNDAFIWKEWLSANLSGTIDVSSINGTYYVGVNLEQGEVLKKLQQLLIK